MISTYLPGLEDSNEPWLILLVVALGAHYSSLATNEDQERLDKEQVSKGLLEQVERRFLPILDSANEEAVQICVLLGSFYVFNGRPNPGLGILGSGVKIAQILRLHQEPQHARMTRVRLESRRRTWWALEVFDKYRTPRLASNIVATLLLTEIPLDMQLSRSGGLAALMIPIAMLIQSRISTLPSTMRLGRLQDLTIIDGSSDYTESSVHS